MFHTLLQFLLSLCCCWSPPSLVEILVPADSSDQTVWVLHTQNKKQCHHHSNTWMEGRWHLCMRDRCVTDGCSWVFQLLLCYSDTFMTLTCSLWCLCHHTSRCYKSLVWFTCQQSLRYIQPLLRRFIIDTLINPSCSISTICSVLFACEHVMKCFLF